MLVMTTVGALEDAQRLGRAAIERRVAACVQVNEIQSIYRWDGEIQTDREWRVLFKTTAQQCAALESLIKELHPYDLPAIVMVNADAESRFALWVDGEVQLDDRM